MRLLHPSEDCCWLDYFSYIFLQKLGAKSCWCTNCMFFTLNASQVIAANLTTFAWVRKLSEDDSSYLSENGINFCRGISIPRDTSKLLCFLKAFFYGVLVSTTISVSNFFFHCGEFKKRFFHFVTFSHKDMFWTKKLQKTVIKLKIGIDCLFLCSVSDFG